jgi:transcriptional regulator with GAF, ATPase, and Fis domain
MDDQEIFPFVGISRIGLEEYQVIGVAEISQMSGVTPERSNIILPDLFGVASGAYNGHDLFTLKNRNPFVQLLVKTFRFESAMIYQLQLSQGRRFVLSFFCRQTDAFYPKDLSLLERLKDPLTLTLDRRIAFEEIDKLRKRLEEENHYLQEIVKTNIDYGEIIGTSESLGEVFKQIGQVSVTDTSVLILGESGTGKELVARSIHDLSRRKDKILVKVNCAALPANLIESELFGHEKGSFTGAFEKRIGKFELANGGSIFLDEIGEMPLELQSKLLRVLQEKEIERVGGKEPIRTDVRIIAATNRNLEKEVNEGRFRLDLYYRLNVFPILLPALRQRKEDIPLLAVFFARKLCKKIGKPFRGIEDKAMGELVQYQWPGNIRELENVIEQAVIINDGQNLLTLGRQLTNKLSGDDDKGTSSLPDGPKTLSEIKQLQQQTEREHILSILKIANGRIRGKNGAAELLNLKPTTLESRMEKLGISRSNI